MSNIKVKLFAIAKDEAAYIPQWVFHHFYFGFDEIEIWLNNITDNSVSVCEKIAQQYPNFKFKIVDDVFLHCQNHKMPFQHVAYSRLFNQELEARIFDYVMFLDLDEFWMPKDFSIKVYEIDKNLLDVGSISFPWYIDEAKPSNMPFASLLTVQNIYPNRHVKSMIRVEVGVKLVHAHNALMTERGRKGVLAMGNEFAIDDSTSNGSVIPVELFVPLQQNISDYFIYHMMNRSQIEYMATLLKPNIQDRQTDAIFKENRSGYLNHGHPMKFAIDQDLLNEYFSLFISFLDDLDLLLEIEQSRLFILEKYIEIRKILERGDEIVSNRIFRGLSLLNRNTKGGKN